MEAKLIQLKGDFNNIISIRTTVKNIFDILQVRIDKLKDLYAEFIKTSKTQMFIFGLDSFHFQSKLIDIEYDDMKRIFLAINNRMYCEYFKLYKIIIDYILNSNHEKKITDLVKVNNYPVYKDLEPFKEYKFEIVSDIHEDILNLLNILLSTITNKENELLIHKGKQRIGLNIDNFITTFNYNITTIKEKLTLFVTYIEFFHKLHTTYLKRFANKIQLMYSHVNNDIQFDESVIIGKQNSDDINENTSSESPTNNKRSIDSRSSTDSRKSTNSKSSTNSKFSTNIELTNKQNIIFDFYENPIDFEINDDTFTYNTRSRTNSLVSSNNSSNSTITPKFTFKDTTNPLTNINTKEETKKIETTLSHEYLNDMFSTIDITCDFLIKKNNETPPVTPPHVTHVMDNDIEIIVEEPNIGDLVNPIISSYFETNDEFIDTTNDDDTAVNETIIKNESDNFLLVSDIKKDNNTDNNEYNNTDNNLNNHEPDAITVTSEVTNDNETNIQAAKKKRKKAKKKN
jgi:hypothetical protein